LESFRTIAVSDPRFECDGMREVTFKSPALGGRADMTLYVPPSAGADNKTNVPLVLLLHGVYGSHWAWSRMGGAHRTASRLIEQGQITPLVLAMPSDGLWGDGSGYIQHGNHLQRNFEQYIVEEIPAAAATIVPAVGPASPLFIAGLSMGGFGALRLGAKYPHKFRGFAGHSSITHFSQMKQFVEEPLDAYGPPEEAEQSVLHFMLKNRDHLPPLRFDCGTEDPLLEYNRTLHAQLQGQNIAHTYMEYPGGHEWPYWEKHLAATLKFFTKCLAQDT
jgi:putative tributyrin esterase